MLMKQQILIVYEKKSLGLIKTEHMHMHKIKLRKICQLLVVN
jgi:hypothetical protein